ncbi:MAG: cobalamin B12-binding domain-containing protein, partial [Bacillota bacterium]|nr:cobalamin B12-binding domain-containing protein [Bacillota bacterium]
MVRCVLCAVNSAYIHKNLAVLKLEKYLSGFDIKVCEFTVNEEYGSVYRALLSENADLYCFSAYIWNIEYCLKLCESLKKALPDALILLGGPEAGMEPSAILDKYGFIDYVISGAGEEPLKSLLDSLENNKEPYTEGIWSRNECFGGYAMAPIDSPMPYSLEDITN